MRTRICYKNITPHLTQLRVLGFYQIDPDESRQKRLLHKIYMGFILFLNSFYTVLQMVLIFTERHNADRVMDTLFLMLTYSDCIFKQLILWVRAERIEKLLDILNGPVFNYNADEYRSTLLRRGYQSKVLLRVFNIACLCTCFLWVLYPMVKFAQNKPVEFAIWMPVDPNLSPQFYFVISFVWIQTSLLAVGNTTTDAFVSFFFALCKAQLSILCFELESLVAKSKKESLEESVPFSVTFHKRFKKILIRYDAIVHVCRETQGIFGSAILYFFIISCWIICTSAYRMLNIDPRSVEFCSMIMYIFCVSTEIYLYCYYGNEVAYESQKLLQATFSMDWYIIPIQCRRPLIIFMERIKRPIIPTAGVIFPLSNNTFITILRTSYSYYTLLKNTQ